MILGKKTLEKLRNLINEESEYRSGRVLVEFFNELGFNDSYGEGFPSRWFYTDEKLEKINGTPKLDKCIKNVLAPINFIGKFQKLDELIKDFNQYLTFDKWKIIRNQGDIEFLKLSKVVIEPCIEGPSSEADFLRREFSDINLDKLELEGMIQNVLQQRINEIEHCFSNDAPLAVILLAGSTLEGILLGLANSYPRKFSSSSASPKDISGKVKLHYKWSLSELINVAKDIGLIQYDTQKFSHSLRDFRNYIHPFEQMQTNFNPREHTAKICLQVLKAAIFEIGENMQKIKI